jgi:signal transduction histidine kinase
MKKSTADLKLKERVKELKCLYELSKIAWEGDHDVKAIFSKTLAILPEAMQFSTLTEAAITVGKEKYSTADFSKCKTTIASTLMVGKKRYGSIKIGYRTSPKSSAVNKIFLPEEKRLIKMVARELSLYIKRASIEEDKKKLQMQLEHAERLAFVGELSAGIAHELNEPFGKILGFAQLIKKAGDLNSQQEEDLERIIKASLYTREIIKKLMIFSRQMPQQLVSINLNTVLSDILYFIDVRFQTKGIKITKRLEPTLPNIQADAVQMSQVLVNLITNAIHALSQGGEILITTKKKGVFVLLTVKDNGVGMTSAIQKKIFKPFFTTKDVGQGTGLGLSVVQGIIETHNGSISVTSTPGKGARFQISLPIKQTKS